MRYEIVATLGPSSATAPIWEGLLAAGASAFRLNTSHLTLEQLDGWLGRLGEFLAAREQPAPLVLDLQGSKWRLGQLAPALLEPGQLVELVHAGESGAAGVLPVPHHDFFAAAPLSNGTVVLNDGKVLLALEQLGAERLGARVVQGGPLAARKGITYAESSYRSEALSPKDQAILERTRGLPAVRYALSYLRDAEEMATYRRRAGQAYLIAKLERRPAIDEVLRIAQSASELWVCRGDLGAELGPAGMARAVHRLSQLVVGASVPVLLAGQVLEHMAEHATPTRSEVCFLYDALLRGYHGVVLSDETAVGRYPVESCQAAALFRE
jgi:pyruvate kinase